MLKQYYKTITAIYRLKDKPMTTIIVALACFVVAVSSSLLMGNHNPIEEAAETEIEATVGIPITDSEVSDIDADIKKGVKDL